MPPEIVTAMVAELGPHVGAPVTERVQDVVLRTGAIEVETRRTGDGLHLVLAEFHSVGDSTRAAVEVVRTLVAAGATGPDDQPVPGLRMALWTGPHDTRDDRKLVDLAIPEPLGQVGPGACPLEAAIALVSTVDPGCVLATEATVVVSGGGLPPGVDLVDRGSRRLTPDRAPERVFELRIAVGPAGEPPHAVGLADAESRSNLDWARRAVAGVGEAHDELDDVMGLLTDAWRRAQGDERAAVLLSSHGTGCKTQVAAELALHLHAGGAQVLYGRWDRDVDAPYQGFREAFGVYADGNDVDQLRADLEGWGDEVASLLPDVAARIGAPLAAGPTPHLLPGDEEGRMAEAVEAWVAALARRKPTLLVLDDVHTAEPSSLMLIDDLYHASTGMPLLIVIAYGPDDDAEGAQPDTPDVLTHAEAGEVTRIDLDD